MRLRGNNGGIGFASAARAHEGWDRLSCPVSSISYPFFFSFIIYTRCAVVLASPGEKSSLGGELFLGGK